MTFAHIAGSLTLNYQGAGGGSGGREGGIKEFRFADGTSWSRAQIDAAYLAQQVTSSDDVIVGSIRDDVIAGAAGNDTLIGNAGNDRLIGGMGNDTMRGGAGDDIYVYAMGDGDDILDEWVTWDGSYDALEFGAEIDPDDLIFTRAGDAYIVTFAHMAGSLTLNYQRTGGGSGGREGGIKEFRFADGTIWSRSQIDAAYLAGQVTSGSDMITGSIRDDMIHGLGGDDTLAGDAGNDMLVGGVGNDLLRGEAGNDVYAYAIGDGDDVVDDPSGQNAVQLGAGIIPGDIYFSASVSSPNDIVIRFDGNPGSITLKNQLAASSANGVQSLSFTDGTVWDRARILSEYLARQGTAGDDYMGGDDTANILSGGAGNDTIRSQGGDDQLTGATGNDRLEGGGGNDSYYYALGDGNDIIADGGSDTADKLVFGPGIAATDVSIDPDQNNAANSIIRFTGRAETILLEQQMTGNKGLERIEFADGSVWDAAAIANQIALGLARAGNDILDGTSGNDNLSGGGGNDALTGRWGNDTLIGGTGNDALDGGQNDDTYVYARGDGNDTIVDNDGWDGGYADTLVLQQIAVADVSLARVGEDIILTIAESASGAGDGGSIRLVNMNLYRANGIEFVTFGDGTRWDASYLRQRVVTEAATGGNDMIAGFDGGETLSGGGGNDTLAGRWGNDTLIGGAGNDALDGGQNDDIYVYARGDGHDTIVDNDSWDGGYADTLALQQIAVADVSLSRVGEDIILTIAESATGAGDGGSIRLINMNPYRANGIEFVTFGDGTRWDANYLRQRVVTEAATSGNDMIAGFDGSESLSGGGGNDTLAGRWGNDTLIGGMGNDALDGGQNDDTYVYARGDGHDTIVDNDSWDGGYADTLALQQIAVADVSLSRVGADIILTIAESASGAGDGGSVRLVNMDPYRANGIEFVTFGDGTRWDANYLRQNAASALQMTAPEAQGYSMMATEGDEGAGGSGGVALRSYRPGASSPRWREAQIDDLRRSLAEFHGLGGWNRYQPQRSTIEDGEMWSGGGARLEEIGSVAEIAGIDQTLAAIVQEMSSFGARSAIEGLSGLSRENLRPIEFFA